MQCLLARILLLPLLLVLVLLRRPAHARLQRRPPDARAVALQQMANAAIAGGAPSITIKGGAYHFSDANFEVLGARKLAMLAPEPVVLWFSASAGVNITNSEDLSFGNWTIDNEDFAAERPNDGGVQLLSAPVKKSDTIITLNLLNCTRVTVSDVNISRGYNMIVTAFNGGGDHHFTRVRFQPSLKRLTRDAIHFSDQRVGPTIEDSVIGYTGDDLFNIHTTLMLVVKCETPTSCVLVNPHLHGPEMMNTVYHTNCVLQNLRPHEDRMSFFKFPSETFATERYGGATGASLTVAGARRVTEQAVLAEAATLVPELACKQKLNPVSMVGNETIPFFAWDVWHVEFEGGHVPAGVGRTALVQIDTISNAGTIIRNSLLTDTNCNLGRFKSSDSVIEGNTFRNADIKNLELAWLPQFFEGPVILHNVSVANNVVQGEGPVPIHCGPFCGSQTCLYGAGDRPVGSWSEQGCAQCPDCHAGETQWTKNIRLMNNTFE